MEHNQIPILLYHSIAETTAPQFKKWVVHPHTFDKHLRYLHEAGYQSFTVSEIVPFLTGEINTPLPEKPVVITFDDGFADFHLNALPIFKRYNLTGTLYIVTKYIGGTSEWLEGAGEGDRPMLTWDQISDIYTAGIECAPHTHTHPLLDLLEKTQYQDEIGRSKTLLEEYLGVPLYSFAYPGGIYSRSVREMVIQLGFTSACAVKTNMSSLNDDRFALSRIPVFDVSIDDLRDLLAGKGLLWPPYERLRDASFRLVRRTQQFFARPPC